MVELGEVLDYEQPTNYIVNSVNYSDKYQTPVLTAGKTFILGYTNEKEGIFPVEKLPVMIFDDFTTAMKLVDFPFKVKSSAMKILHSKKEKADIKFLFYVMQKIEFAHDEHKRYWISQYSKIKIPLPPLGVQKAIVAEIDGYQNIIDGAKQVVDNYTPTIKLDPDWPMVKLVKVFKLSSGKGLSRKNQVSGPYTVYGGNGVTGSHSEYFLENRTLIIGRVGAYCGAVHITEPKSWITDNALYVTEYLIQVNQVYLAHILRKANINQYAKVGGQPSISQSTVANIDVPLPAISVQEEIVAQIEAEQEIVNANKKLIEIYEQKIKDKIAEVWGEK